MDANTLQQFQLILNCSNAISQFNGNDINQLPDFFGQVESLLSLIQRFDANKCTGRTMEVIHRSGEVNDWPELKPILLSNLGKRKVQSN